MNPSKKLRKDNNQGVFLYFWCPGCGGPQIVDVEKWKWNGSTEQPTFSPSILTSYEGPDADREGRPPAKCHSFVTDGRIQFLDDCTHALRGQTVDVPDWPRPDWGGVEPIEAAP